MKKRLLILAMVLALCLTMVPVFALAEGDTTSDAEETESSEPNGEDADGEEAEGEDADAEDAEGEDADAEDAEGEDADAEDAEGEDADAEDAEDEDADAEDAEGEDADAEETDAVDPLDGADDWAVEELALALEAGLVLDEMIGNWKQPMTRLLAAEAIVRLIEVSTGKTIDEIAEENEYDMEDTFDDTDSKAVTFLKAAGISDGVGDNMYSPSGIYNRAQMVTMLGRMAMYVFDIDISEYPPGSDVFTDVPDWADAFVGWAAAVGITKGVSDDLFDSNGPLQNQHTGMFAYRAFDKVFSA